jgi:hypothetical protein
MAPLGIDAEGVATTAVDRLSSMVPEGLIDLVFVSVVGTTTVEVDGEVPGLFAGISAEISEGPSEGPQGYATEISVASAVFVQTHRRSQSKRCGERCELSQHIHVLSRSTELVECLLSAEKNTPLQD